MYIEFIVIDDLELVDNGFGIYRTVEVRESGKFLALCEMSKHIQLKTNQRLISHDHTNTVTG